MPAKKKLSAIAITDHDTVAGVAAAVAAGKVHGVTVVPGIEISAACTTGTLHILGYYIDTGHTGLRKTITTLQQARARRNPGIIQRLQALGLDITLEEVAARAGGGQVGRPHVAQVLIDRGYVKTFRQAFDRYLKKGAPAYVEKFRFPPGEAIALIRAAGGIPVLAHPATLGYKTGKKLEALLQDMTADGILGIEVYYPDHTGRQTALFEKLAEKLGLLMTGGSDFHGHVVKGLDIGTGKGSLRVSDKLLAKLQAAHAALQRPG